MAEPVRPSELLRSLAEAFARGESANGEILLQRALDHGIPWDEVTFAAARGVERRHAGCRPSVAGRRLATDGLVSADG